MNGGGRKVYMEEKVYKYVCGRVGGGALFLALTGKLIS